MNGTILNSKYPFLTTLINTHVCKCDICDIFFFTQKLPVLTVKMYILWMK